MNWNRPIGLICKREKNNQKLTNAIKRNRDKETECGSVDWIHLAQVMDQWRALVNTVINLRNSLKAGNVFTT
jgi:hypothetical protein